ncbi:MAG: 23S rRNA (adenine(2503)-C(2))-methyltransferase RlmN [Planctomycetales bacterium]|nr:23S rRNA (adenine(2503)-C(2))-methyltransferase RlmN [Planctomycetales bacterium]
MRHLLDSGLAERGEPSELAQWLAETGQPKFRAAQIRRWLAQGRAESVADMTDLPQSLRAGLGEAFQLWSMRVVRHDQAADGTEKLLLETFDGGRVECVLLRDGVRRSICVSSQVGCAMGCVFCASGLDGVERNLTRGEILEQMLQLQRLLPADERLSHIVMMGMGEPLANLDRVLAALGDASHKQGLGISPRRITISTVGLPPAIDRLVREQRNFQLAVSLHAPTDALRDELVPVNRKSGGLGEILAAADRYFEASGRRLTFEYVLLGDINDSADHARQLGALLKGRIALLNVIPYNPVAGLPYRTPSPETQRQFRELLEQAGVNVQFRQRKGDEINAACGQLRRSMARLTTIEPRGTA